MTMDDQTLLRQYVQHRSETAFAELVERHFKLVYSAALRRVRESHLAQDVAQSVFIELARKPWSVRDPRALAGWLYRAASHAASSVLRAEGRRRERENEAMRQNTIEANPSTEWQRLEPHLDEAIHTLGAIDQNVIALRFLEGKSLRETGQALSMTEDAVQKRASRALARLRDFFARRGLTLSAAALGTLLAANTEAGIPPGLSAAITGSALAAAASYSAITFTVMRLITSLNTKLVLGMLAAAAVAAALVPTKPVKDAGSDIIEKLKAFDNTVLQQHTLTIERTQAKQFFFDYDNVGFRETVTVTVDGDTTAYSITRYYDKEPSYPTNLPSHNYDKEGSFINWRDTKRQGLISPELNANRAQRVTKKLTPDNQVLIDDEGAPRVEFRDVGDAASIETYVLDYLAPILSTGRGYGSLLVRVKEIIEETPNEITFTAYGRFGREKALWKIAVDTQNRYLVRSAQFYGEGNPPILSFSTKGTKWYGDLCVAETATIWIDKPSNVVTEKVQKYEPKADRELIDNIRGIFTDLSPNTDVVDWRGNRKEPLMYRVGHSPL
jgi:RNA polymerase sigma factor (sigma-70 family)